ncbi:MAG: hypothetical protein GEV06_06120 [Luteitalea sp.]|nr:hypothetical protein [Luteitalea sp.]
MTQREVWATVVLCAVVVPSAGVVQGLPAVGALQTAQPSQAPAVPQATGQPLTLEVRVFDATDEVTSETRVRVFKAGNRTDPRTIRATSGVATVDVPAGFYDLQAVREREGQVAGIRWAERRLVQRYPDQQGRHMEMVNLQPGYGALQIRRRSSTEPGDVTWRASIYKSGNATEEAGRSNKGDGYLLFVVPAGSYDVQVLPAIGQPIWLRDVELPADQTRFKTWE